ncbi:putative cobalt-precorrin-6Y C(15)-methyltransferase [mine drainage metagenome]|uniref:Putative cobalt-precorrin-6Y C(15)-methyltransferase n=1 Tax=mine drainage metagenome TaxID=410659 RepID=A0A1J5SWX6_9ZZZZ
MREPCRIIGVLDNGVDGLTPVALAHLQLADMVIGAGRTLSLFESVLPAQAERRDMGGQLTSVPGWISQARDAGRRVVVLATGDPLCHGIASFLIGKLGLSACEILPNISTLQWAFARLGLPWQEAKICSIHSKDAGEWSPGASPEHGLYALLQAVRRHDLLAVLTSPDNTPARIARMLVSEGLGDAFQLSVVTRIFQMEKNESMEKIIGPIVAVQCVDLVCADPNVVILQRCQPRTREILFGLDDSEFLQRKPDKGLITKREVRAVSLARMQLRADSIVWDIGAGSGSVGLEAARLCPQGHVYAIEKNVDDAAIAMQNRQRLGIANYTLINDKAPKGMDMWPDPDAMFVGGSGGELEGLLRMGLQRLKPNGWLIMNFVTFENLNVALATLIALSAVWDVTQLQASRSQPILHMHRLQAENPVWIVSAQRKQP